MKTSAGYFEAKGLLDIDIINQLLEDIYEYNLYIAANINISVIHSIKRSIISMIQPKGTSI